LQIAAIAAVFFAEGHGDDTVLRRSTAQVPSDELILFNLHMDQSL
jgi:hypothetical protein